MLKRSKTISLSISRLLNTSTLFLLLLSFTSYAQWSQPPSEEIVIRGGWLFDGISNTRRQNKGIVIRDGEIVEVDANIQEKRRKPSGGVPSNAHSNASSFCFVRCF